MVKQLWINLPVNDINHSKKFFTALGFKLNTRHETENSACLLIGEQQAVVMLFTKEVFTGFTGNELPDTLKANEVLLSIDAETKEEVDLMAELAVKAGGTSSHVVKEMDGWMYGCVFSDIDGHKWNVLFMDPLKMPK